MSAVCLKCLRFNRQTRCVADTIKLTGVFVCLLNGSNAMKTNSFYRLLATSLGFVGFQTSFSNYG